MERPDEVLSALADPTRGQVLHLLGTLGEATATSLATHLPVTRQAVVQHLAVLGDAALVEAHRHGREMRYRVRPERLVEAATWMTDMAATWDARLATIKRIAEVSSPDSRSRTERPDR